MGVPRKTVGALLRQFLDKERASSADLAGELGISEAAVNNWLRGDAEIDVIWLPKIRDFLDIDPDHYHELITARFPAFDPVYLADRPSFKQGGALLKACYERMDLMQKDVAEQMGLEPVKLRQRVQGSKYFSEEELGRAVAIFASANEKLPQKDRWFDAKMARRLCETCVYSNPKSPSAAISAPLLGICNAQTSADAARIAGALAESKKPLRGR